MAPFPLEEISTEISRYSHATDYLWVQDEIQNGGAWNFVQPIFNQLLSVQNNIQKNKNSENFPQKNIRYVGRPPCPTSATGISVVHKKETEALMKEAFD